MLFRSGRVAGLTCSGGGATMLADYAEKLGLVFRPPSKSAAENLRHQLPATATVSNPLDYTTPIWGIAEKTRPVFATLLGDGHDAAVIVQDYPAAGLDESKIYYRNDTRSFIEAAKEAKLAAAVCSTIPENLDAETRQFLVDHGVAPMQGIEECMTAIAQAAWHGRRRNEIAAEHRMPLLPPMPLSAAVALREWRAQREAWRERVRSAALEHEPLSRRERRKLQRAGLLEVTPEERIRGVQRRMVSSVITIGILAAVNAATSPRFPWFLFPALAIGIGVVSRIGSLWVDGIPFSRLFRRQPYVPPADTGTPRPAAAGQARLAAPDLSGVAPGVIAGPHGPSVREAAEAKAVIADVYGRLPELERASLPDVGATGAALFDRIRQLATALHQLDRDASPDALRKLDERIAEARAGAEGTERDRRRELLERQRSTLADLIARRATVADQLDSAVLLLQTMKLDMLKLRSAGIESNIADSTLATQDARAVVTDIERLVDAAGEVRRL